VKKILISALVVAMGLGISATALAVTSTPAVQQPPAFSDIAGHEAECALTLLGSLGIYTGDSGLGGLAKPDDPITRAQFCKVVVTAMGRASTAAGLAGLQPTFTDGASIPTWAWGYVNVAVYLGIINGYADGSFKANNPVTYAESVTMLIRAVPGHLAQVTPGIWPYNFLFYGVDEGFTGDECFGIVDVGFANLPASRGDIALMLVATMQKEKLNTLGAALPGTAQLYMFDDVVTNYNATSVTFATAGAELLALKYWICGAANLEGLRNLAVCYVYNAADCVYYLCVCTESNVVTGVHASLTTVDSTTYIKLADGTTVPYVAPVTVTLNQVAGHNQLDLAAGDELVIVVGDDSKAANVEATRFEDLDYITDFTKSVGGTTPVDTQIDTYNTAGYAIPATCKVELNGAISGRDLLAVSDAVVIALVHDTTTPMVIKANRVAVEGTVAGTTTTWPGPVDRVTIDLKAGGSKTYILNGDGGIFFPSKGDIVNYGLDFDGAVYVPVGYETLTPYAVCRSYTVTGTDDYSATFDIRGQEVTYKLDGPLPLDIGGDCEWINTYCYLSVDTGTGTVIVGDSVGNYGDADCCDYEVLSVDAVNGTLTLAEDGNLGDIVFWDDPDFVVYDPAADGTLVYIGLAGLSVGDWVTGCLCYPGDPDCWPVATWIETPAP